MTPQKPDPSDSAFGRYVRQIAKKKSHKLAEGEEEMPNNKGGNAKWLMNLVASAFGVLMTVLAAGIWSSLTSIHVEQMRSAEARAKIESDQSNTAKEMALLRDALKDVVANQTTMDRNLSNLLTYLRGTLPGSANMPPPKSLPYPSPR